MTTPAPRLSPGSLLAVAAFFFTTWWAPRLWCDQYVDLFTDEAAPGPSALARGVAEHIERGPSAKDFSTGDALFDAEWAFGTHVMAVLGISQVILAQPDQRQALLPDLQLASRRLLEPALRSFGTERWGSDGLLEEVDGHDHAYLGYLALALSLSRQVDPAPDWREAHDALIEKLARRVAASPSGLIETYPGEAYPVDVSSIVGAVAVHDRVTGGHHPELLAHFRKQLRARYLDPQSGLLSQCARADIGAPLGPARGSGTALATYFISFADRALARDLYRGLQKNSGSVAGFGGAFEYGPGVSGGGDVDSGPVLLGVGVSTTGFMLAGAKIFGDEKRFRTLMRTTSLFGMPHQQQDRLHFAAGGPLGDAILLAMITAGPGVAK